MFVIRVVFNALCIIGSIADICLAKMDKDAKQKND